MAEHRVHWLAATIIIVVVICAIGVEAWFFTNQAGDEVLAYVLLALVALFPMLALYLFPVYRPFLRRARLAAPRIRQHTQWKPWTVSSVLIMFMLLLFTSRSFWFSDSLQVRLSPTSHGRVQACHGVVEIVYATAPAWGNPRSLRFNSWKAGRMGHARVTGFSRPSGPFRVSCWYGRFSWHRWKGVQQYAGQSVTSVAFPLWVPLILFGIAPALAIWRGYQRYREGAVIPCLSCGYDLTGNVSGVCPECGTAIPAKS